MISSKRGKVKCVEYFSSFIFFFTTPPPPRVFRHSLQNKLLAGNHHKARPLWVKSRGSWVTVIDQKLHQALWWFQGNGYCNFTLKAPDPHRSALVRSYRLQCLLGKVGNCAALTFTSLDLHQPLPNISGVCRPNVSLPLISEQLQWTGRGGCHERIWDHD